MLERWERSREGDGKRCCEEDIGEQDGRQRWKMRRNDCEKKMKKVKDETKMKQRNETKR